MCECVCVRVCACVCVRVCMHNYVGNENQLESNTLVMVGEGSQGEDLQH